MQILRGLAAHLTYRRCCAGVFISFREGVRDRRPFGAPALRLPRPAQSCRARCLLNGALRWWQRTQHHRFPFLGLCRSGQWPMRSTAMARHHQAVAQLRPATRSCAAASRCAWWQRHITALPCSRLCSPSQWARWRVPPCPAITRLSRGARGLCSVRPLRPPASLLHNAALPSVPASRYAKAPLGACHRYAPFGCACTVALVRRCAPCGWSVACGQSCGVCPRPPVGLAAARLGYALNCPSAPQRGSLSQRAAGAALGATSLRYKNSSCLRNEY